MRVPVDEDATFARIAHTEESTTRIKEPYRGLIGQIGVYCYASEHLSTFHHRRLFTRFLEYNTAVCFESDSTGGKFSGTKKVFNDFGYDTEKGIL